MARRTTNQGQNTRYIRKALFKIIIIGIIGFFLWCGWVYTEPSRFPIQHVKIFATYEHVDQKALQKTISSYLDHGFFYLNVIGLKQQLLQFPWIYAVAIKREWPATVEINVVEQRAILQWGTKALVNSEGAIFSPPPATFPSGLPTIYGPDERRSEIFIVYKKIQTSFEPLDLTVKQLVLNSGHYWEIVLSNNMTVYLKEAEPLEQVELLVNLYRKITADHKQEPKSIDLRYNTGLAVKWSENEIFNSKRN